MPTGELTAVVVLGVLHVGCLIHLWLGKPGGVVRKLIWSLVLAVPAVGLLLYSAADEAASRRRGRSGDGGGPGTDGGGFLPGLGDGGDGDGGD